MIILNYTSFSNNALQLRAFKRELNETTIAKTIGGICWIHISLLNALGVASTTCNFVDLKFHSYYIGHIAISIWYNFFVSKCMKMNCFL